MLARALTAVTLAALLATGTATGPGAAAVSVKPSAPVITGTEVGSERATLRWSPPVSVGTAPVRAYRVVRRSADLAGTPRWGTRVSARTRSFTFTGLRNEVDYVLLVRAITAAGWGPPRRVTVRPTARPQAPDITGTEAGDGTSTLSWAAAVAPEDTPVTSYRVARNGTDREGKGRWGTRVSARTRSFTFTLLRNEVDYVLLVRAINAAGWGPPRRVTVRPTARLQAPVITGTAVGDGTMTLSWAATAAPEDTPVTGYRVARDGTDREGKGPWSTVVGADERTFTMTLLHNETSYAFSVAAVSAAGTGAATTRHLTPTGAAPPPPPAPAGDRPVVVQSAVGQPATLRRGGPGGARLRMAGVSVWGVPDSVTGGGGFALGQYADREKIAATVRAWGGNHLRLRVLADDYNHDRQGLSKAQRLAMIRGWRDAATAHGLYLYVTWWDSLDGYAEDANWPTRYRSAFAMMTDVYRTLGDDEHVFYEPFNEPNGFGDQWNAWGAAMRDTVAHWRSMGYTGVLIIDTPVWSHAYDDAAMRALETFDAGRPGMGGRHQVVFARHDYANEGWADGGNTFEPERWRGATGGAQRHHLVWETEYGNYNGDPSSVHLSWSQQASRFFADELDNAARPHFVGATSFVWGPWWDANGLTQADNTTPTDWGRAVRDGFLARAGATHG